MLRRGARHAERLALTALALVAVLALVGLLIAHFNGGSYRSWVEAMLIAGGGVLLVVFGLIGGAGARSFRAGGGITMNPSPPIERKRGPDLTFGALLVPIAVICVGILVRVLP
jgi:hypothetical protein